MRGAALELARIKIPSSTVLFARVGYSLADWLACEHGMPRTSNLSERRKHVQSIRLFGGGFFFNHWRHWQASVVFFFFWQGLDIFNQAG